MDVKMSQVRALVRNALLFFYPIIDILTWS
jgi:hypothetical protein